MEIKQIIIHCAATPDGQMLGSYGKTGAAEIIDRWHARNGWHRRYEAMKQFNPHLTSIGYHFVIDTDGTISTGRKVGEIGAHARGHNTGSVGICLIGTRRFTRQQWDSLNKLVRELSAVHDASIHGHREFAAKECPGFDVRQWLKNGRITPKEHLYV